jgi:hypothetical protein
MLYAKINGDSLLRFPYILQNLHEENNQTSYDNRFDLVGWYKQTEEALRTSYLVVEVNLIDKPDFDEQTQYLKLKQTPQKINDGWFIGWDIEEKANQVILP